MKSPIKWAGGKRQLLDVILPKIPLCNHYYEPFVGGGSVYLAVKERFSFLRHNQIYFISDLNSKLVNTYNQLKLNWQPFQNYLSDHPEELVVSQEQFYKHRKRINEINFNEGEPPEFVKLQDAVSFLYINKYGFNGLWRENSKGECNTPYGWPEKNRKTTPSLNDVAGHRPLEYLHDVLSTKTLITCQSYDTIVPIVGSFFYLDPPYIPVKEGGFDTYTAGGFDHLKFAEWVKNLNSMGCKFLLSQSDTPLSRELFKDFKIEEVQASRRINSDATKRGKVTELLISNY